MRLIISKDVLKVEKVENGRLSLNITDKESWESFPDYAEALMSLIGAKLIKKSDSFDMRIWCLQYEDVKINLVFDDFPVMVSLESMDERGDEAVFRIREKLLSLS